MDGKNISDFIDPDILERLEELEREEEMICEQEEMESEDSVPSPQPLRALVSQRATGGRGVGGGWSERALG